MLKKNNIKKINQGQKKKVAQQNKMASIKENAK